MKEFNVQITNQIIIEFLLNESFCNLSKYHIFTCNKTGRHVLLKNKMIKNQKDPACEFLIFGSVKNGMLYFWYGFIAFDFCPFER